MAYPSKLNPEVHGKIVQLIRAGNYLETAASAAGIRRDTIREWIKRGQREGKGAFADFSRDVLEAMAEAEARDVLSISKGVADGDWKAAAWRLERKYPKRWGQKINVAIHQELDSFFDRLERELPPEIYGRVMEIAASTSDDSGEEETSGGGGDR